MTSILFGTCFPLFAAGEFLLSDGSKEDDTEMSVALQLDVGIGGNFRGTSRIGDSPALGGGLEISALGWSGGASWMESTGSGGGEGTAFVGYHYPLGPVDIGAGLYGTWVTNGLFDDTVETYLSVAADPVFLGITPSATYYIRLDEAKGGYGELKLTRLWTSAQGQLDFAPYVLFGFGDYYANSYSANHIETGVGVAWHLSNHWSLGFNGGVVIPLDGVKAATGNEDAAWFLGLSLRTDGLSLKLGPPNQRSRIIPVISTRIDFVTKDFFRGVPRLGDGPALGGGLEISALGWSGGASWMESTGSGGGEGTAFVGYHYPLGPVDIGAGLYGTWVTNGLFDDTVETYLSVAADPVFLGITPSATYYIRLDEAKGGYGELKFTRLWTSAHGRFDFAPYVLFGFGDYYCSSYDANQVESGVGVTWHIFPHCDLQLHGALITPFGDARAKGEDTLDGFVGTSLRWIF